MNERKQLIKDIVLDIICGREPVEYDPFQFGHLSLGVVEVLIRRKIDAPAGYMPYEVSPEIADPDADIVREVFWDLVVEKVITIGLNPANPGLPWFKLHSEFNPKTKARG